MFAAIHSPGQAGAGSIEKETAMLATIVRLFREWQRYTQSVNELYRLGDRELADIGISRSESFGWPGTPRITKRYPSCLKSARGLPRAVSILALPWAGPGPRFGP